MSKKATLNHLANLGKPVVIAAVTDQASCDRLIRAGSMIAREMGVGLKVVSVQPFNHNGFSLGLNLDYLYQVAKDYDAEMSVFYHDDPLLMLGAFINRNHTVALVAGTTAGGYEGGFILDLRRSFPALTVHLVDPENAVYELAPLAYTRGRKRAMKVRRLGEENT